MKPQLRYLMNSMCSLYSDRKQSVTGPAHLKATCDPLCKIKLLSLSYIVSRFSCCLWGTGIHLNSIDIIWFLFISILLLPWDKTTGFRLNHKDQMGDPHLLPSCSLWLHQEKSGHVAHSRLELLCYIIQYVWSYYTTKSRHRKWGTGIALLLNTKVQKSGSYAESSAGPRDHQLTSWLEKLTCEREKQPVRTNEKRPSSHWSVTKITVSIKMISILCWISVTTVCTTEEKCKCSQVIGFSCVSNLFWSCLFSLPSASKATNTLALLSVTLRSSPGDSLFS